MHRKWLGRFVVGVIVVLLASYALLAGTAGRMLSLAEYHQFGTAILRAGVLHSNENGGPRSLALMRAALTAPAVSDTYTVGGQSYTVPLPPYTVPLPDQEHVYITFATDAQLAAYHTSTLALAGWGGYNQMGAGHFWRNGTTHLSILEKYYLGTGICELSIAVTAP